MTSISLTFSIYLSLYPTELDPNVYIGSFQLRIPIRAAMAPKSKVLVYYAKEDGEVVAGSVEFEVQRCFDNNVSISGGSNLAIQGLPFVTFFNLQQTVGLGQQSCG